MATQILTSIIFVYRFIKREDTIEYMRVLNITLLFTFFIWASPHLITSIHNIGNEITRYILMVTHVVLIYFSITVKRYVDKEKGILDRIETEKRKMELDKKKNEILRESREILGDLKHNYDEKLAPSFQDAIQMVLYMNTFDLPHRVMKNSEFYNELKILHPLIEELLPIANQLTTGTNLKTSNPSNSMNKVAFDFLTDENVMQHYGIPKMVGHTPNPLIKLLRGCLKGMKGENRLERELGVDFKNKTIYYNLNLSDGEDSIEIDALMIIGNAVLSFESKHYAGESITFEKNGQARIVKNNKAQIIDVVSQINRHHRVLKNILGETIEIYNFFVLTDKKTKLINGFDNKYFKVAYIDGLSFFIRELDLTESEPNEELINDVLLNAKISERTYDNIDLRYLRELLQSLCEKETCNFDDSLNFANILSASPLLNADTNSSAILNNIEIYKKLYSITRKHLNNNNQ